jgi:uncharacterized RDD family membrane protein YckC
MSKLLDEPLLIIFVFIPVGCWLVFIFLTMPRTAAFMMIVFGLAFCWWMLVRAITNHAALEQIASADPQPLEYAGFVSRLGAVLADFVPWALACLPFLYLLGPNINPVLAIANCVLVVTFWAKFGATPGQMIFPMRVVDANTGRKPSVGQLVGRLFAYVLSALPLGLGFFWILWDPRRQGWHDKLAGTVVVRPTRQYAARFAQSERARELMPPESRPSRAADASAFGKRRATRV